MSLWIFINFLFKNHYQNAGVSIYTQQKSIRKGDD